MNIPEKEIVSPAPIAVAAERTGTWSETRVR